MKTNIQFTNKDEYLTYRENWRIQYKQLSQTIRDYKFIKWAGSLGKKRFTPEIESQYNTLVKKHNPNNSSGSWIWEIIKLKEKATAMLEERKASKIEAQRQYLVSKAQEQELVAA